MRFISLNREGVNSLSKRASFTLALLSSSLAFFLASPSFSADLPNWKQDVNAGLEEGKRSHKYVLADIYTDWCGWCKRLDRETFSNENMSKFLNEKFVCIKANAEDNGAGQKLASQYRVAGYPCALVFDPNGKFIGKISGYREARAYQEALSQMMANPPANPMSE